MSQNVCDLKNLVEVVDYGKEWTRSYQILILRDKDTEIWFDIWYNMYVLILVNTGLTCLNDTYIYIYIYSHTHVMPHLQKWPFYYLHLQRVYREMKRPTWWYKRIPFPSKSGDACRCTTLRILTPQRPGYFEDPQVYSSFHWRVLGDS